MWISSGTLWFCTLKHLCRPPLTASALTRPYFFLPPLSCQCQSPFLVQTPLVKLDCREVVVAVRIVLLSPSHPLLWPCPALSTTTVLLWHGLLLSFDFLCICRPCLVLSWREMDQALRNRTILFASLLSFPFSLSLCVYACMRVFLKEHVLPCQLFCPLQRYCVLSCSQSLHTVLAVSW